MHKNGWVIRDGLFLFYFSIVLNFTNDEWNSFIILVKIKIWGISGWYGCGMAREFDIIAWKDWDISEREENFTVVAVWLFPGLLGMFCLFSLLFFIQISERSEKLFWLDCTTHRKLLSPKKKAYMGLGFQYQLGLWIQGRWFFLNEMKLWWVLDILSYYSIFKFFLRFFFSSFFSKVVMDLNGMDLVVYIVVCGRVGVRESSSYHLGCLYGNGFHRMVNISMKEAKEQIWYINVDVGGKRVHLWMNHSRR